MKLELNGKILDVENALARAELTTLFELKSKHGIGMKSLLKSLDKFSGLDAMDMLEDTETFQTFLVLIWLARRYAGEKLSLEEAGAFPLTDLKWIEDDEDEESPKV